MESINTISPDCLVYCSGRPSSIYFWVPAVVSKFEFAIYDLPIDRGEMKNNFTLFDPHGETILTLNSEDGKKEAWTTHQIDVNNKPGIWELVISSQDPSGLALNYFMLRTCGAFPFIIPEAGIVPWHFSKPGPCLNLAPPKFGGSDVVELFIDVPEGLSNVTVLTMGLREREVLCDASGQIKPIDFHVTGAQIFAGLNLAYRAAELHAQGKSGWWRFQFKAPARMPVSKKQEDQEETYRFSTLEGLPLFLHIQLNVSLILIYIYPPALLTASRFPHAFPSIVANRCFLWLTALRVQLQMLL